MSEHSTMLGYERHGILSIYITIEGDGWGCAFGGYALDTYDDALKRRVGTAFGCQFLIEVLRVVGVDSWETLTGQYVRVETEGWGRIRKLGHITKDQWFDPVVLVEAWRSACNAVGGGNTLEQAVR